MSRKIHPTQVLSLSGVLDGGRHVRSQFGPEYELLVLSSDKTAWFDDRTGRASNRPFVYAVHRDYGSGWHSVLTTAPCEKRYNAVQPLSGERLLLAELRITSAEAKNGDVYGANETLLSSMSLGDGIEDLQTTKEGNIWVSYFDEGVYGGGKVEHSGLVCFDATGTPRFRFWNDIAEPGQLPPIDDCYALNVVSDREVWATYYSDFPVVKLQDYKLDGVWLDFPKRPARALAVFQNRLLLAPAYNKNDPLILVHLVERTTEEVEALDENCTRLPLEYAFARGRKICVVLGGHENPVRLYVFDMAEMD